MDEMISFGAGVNSVAMVILLVEQGWTGPIVFADTGAEHPETYCYLEYFQRHFLDPHDLRITFLQPGSEYHSKTAQLPLEQLCLKRGIIPMLAVRWCSVEWKRDPLVRWAKTHDVTTSLVGISADEPKRVRNDPTVRYPLVEEGINRAECRRIILQAGLLVPDKNGCFFCPGQALAQWRQLYIDHPDLYTRAEAMEDNATIHCQKPCTLDPHGKATLRQHKERRWEGQSVMDLTPWLPCACAT